MTQEERETLQIYPALAAGMPQSYIEQMNTEKGCYKCGMDNGSTPCTNCGYSGELVLRKDRQPLMPHNQPFLHL